MDNFRSGQTLKLEFESQDYLPADGYSGKFQLAPINGGGAQHVDATGTGTTYTVTETPTNTDTWVPGTYRWFFVVTNGSDSFILEEGTMEILPSIGDLVSTDSRSHVKKVLDALNTLIEGKSSKDVLSYAIAGRQLTKMTPEEILKWKKYYTELYRREVAAEARKNGRKTNSRVLVRF